MNAVDGFLNDDDDNIEGLSEVAGLTQVGAAAAQAMNRAGVPAQRAVNIAKRMQGASGLSTDPFMQSTRSTERRAPLGFTENSTGNNFFSLPATIGATTTMRAKVSRVAHVNRLLIVPSAPGVVIESIKVGDDEQCLAAGVPVELYGTSALTDSVPDNFAPLAQGIDFIVTLKNTVATAITGTIGTKASCKR